MLEQAAALRWRLLQSQRVDRLPVTAAREHLPTICCLLLCLLHFVTQTPKVLITAINFALLTLSKRYILMFSYRQECHQLNRERDQSSTQCKGQKGSPPVPSHARCTEHGGFPHGTRWMQRTPTEHPPEVVFNLRYTIIYLK